MSKHLGNILEPIPLMDQHGADAVRWFMAGGGSPWPARRVGHAAIQEVVRKTLLTYWNTVVVPGRSTPAPPAGSPATGRPRCRRAPASSTAGCCPRRTRLARRGRRGARGLRHPARRPAARGVRRRPVQLVRPPLPPPLLGRRPRGARHAARGLRRVTLLMAPLTPFITERVWQDLFASDGSAARPTRCTWRPGRASTTPASTTSWPSRWRWSAGWSSSAAPPAPTPG